jgi:endonuclease/exonuclease/phosphatase family metal-dependent hydrolase
MKILTYNIHKGFSLDQRFVLDSIRKAVESVDADIVFLQEVVGENHKYKKIHDTWPVTTQLEFLGESMWPHFAYGKNAVYSEGHHGNAILSRMPIGNFENIDISTNRLEKRGLLHATISDPFQNGPELHVICLHLNLFEGGRVIQYDRLVKRIHEHVPDESPLIIAGDFNDWRENASPLLEQSLGVVEAHQSLFGEHALSFPSWFPLLRLDRIYVRGLKVISAKCFVESPWDKLSDHGALYAELEP